MTFVLYSPNVPANDAIASSLSMTSWNLASFRSSETIDVALAAAADADGRRGVLHRVRRVLHALGDVLAGVHHIFFHLLQRLLELEVAELAREDRDDELQRDLVHRFDHRVRDHLQGRR